MLSRASLIIIVAGLGSPGFAAVYTSTGKGVSR